MSSYHIVDRACKREQGQTIVLVALTVVTILAMAALAIDVVTLYVARSEMQRAADAAALAGARAFVDSGVTSDPTNLTRQTLAQNVATAIINSTVQQNKIGGVQPALAGAPAFDFTRPGNPQLSVTLQRTDLPMFFARIWGNRPMTVTASAVAEAYNSSSSQTSTGNYVPIQPKCVKPLLVINSHAGAPLINVATGAPTTGLIGQRITLTSPCTHTPAPGCFLPLTVGDDMVVPATVANPPNPNNLCPSCAAGSDYEQSIACCDFNNFISYSPGSAPSPYSCGGTVANVLVDTVTSRNAIRRSTNNGVSCLIDKPSQDTIDAADLTAGTGPAKITAASGPQSGNLVSTSRSIVNLPIIDPGPAKQITANQQTVIGFLQFFVEDSTGGGGGALTVTGVILNVIGCGNNPSGTAVASGSATAIPVRLIH
jgi:Putative Flp pilus-assembly TadE/G-like